MSDTKWGYQSNYGHRQLPFEWHVSSGFSLYDHDPLRKKSFRPAHIPVQREDFGPLTTNYGERSQDSRWAMSNYGCHRELSWDNSLRAVRNPFPGKPKREMTYLQEQSPRVSLHPSGAGTPRNRAVYNANVAQDLMMRDAQRDVKSSPRGGSLMTPRHYGRLKPLAEYGTSSTNPIDEASPSLPS
eukprot:TRINITY_DN66725_c0_g1_i1.p1 TRINITY_DN66725_c0_g1~~TRINITY_DN66725_c0_g1_i1.p1  ORF type:complete len:185 (-),score=15.47 TRINITY_DN66725_c0_g1_i1:114-668(-)